MPRRIITEEELREAAREVLEYELAIFDSYNDYPDHIFHGKFRLDMAALIHEVKRGAVEAAKYSMGFTFYAKQCIAAVLILFTLSCIAMPETVLAGYHKLIEVIETVFEDYTEYRYRVNDDGGIEETFKPLKLGYLPEGMEEIRRQQNKHSIDILYTDKTEKKERYLNLFQREVISNSEVLYIADNTNSYVENINLKDASAIIMYDEEEIRFIIQYKNGYILGYAYLSVEEVKKIVYSLEI